MLEILFGSPKEAETIYAIFRSMCKEIDSELQLINQQCVKISPKTWDISIEELVIPGIVRFIVDHKEHMIMLTIIKEIYYFQDEEEQQQILHIAQSIIEGERTDIPRLQHLLSRDVILKNALEQFLRPNLYFSFTSFQKFRLQEYMVRLREYVEAAIEEYKLEQEYQNFIQSLRDYLTAKDSVIGRISIVHDNGYFVYYPNNRKVTDLELKNYIDHSFVNQHPMYIDNQLLGPIVSIAPNLISLYTNDPFDGMVQTIQNIFQEKVIIHSLDEFRKDRNSLMF
jgi:putative sporulation protein YtxC